MVEYLLSNTDVLLEEERARLSKAASNGKGSGLPRSRLNEALVTIQKTSRSDMALPKSIEDQFVIWKQRDGISFWDEEFHGHESQKFGNIVSSVYYKLRRAEASSKILRRLSTVGLCILAEQTAQKYGLKRVELEIFQLLVDLVQKGMACSDSEDIIGSNLRDDIAAGSKYRSYGKELGGLGTLFHLPGSVPDYM